MISIVVPVYRSASTLAALHHRLSSVLERCDGSQEIIFVDDACPGGSLIVLERLAEFDPRIRIVRMPRNVGQHRAVIAGLAHARGTRIVVLDADLQDPPEAIPALLEAIDGQASAAFAGRRGRHQGFGRLLTSQLFKRALHQLCGTPADAGLFVAMNREMATRLVTYDDAGPSVLAMMGCSGLPLTSIPVARATRLDGGSSYSAWRRLTTSLSVIVWVIRWKWRSAMGHE